MEAAAFVVKRFAGRSDAFLARAERTEIVGRFGNDIVVKFEDNFAGRCAANGDVKPHTISLRGRGHIAFLIRGLSGRMKYLGLKENGGGKSQVVIRTFL
jgi:hypothetical protein